MIRRRAIFAPAPWALILATACGPEPSDNLLAASDDSGQDSLAVDSAEIHFYANWTITVDGDLVVNNPLRIIFDEDRLARCRSGTQGGHQTWSVTAFWSIDQGPIHAQAIAGLDSNGGGTAPGYIDIVPERAGDLAMWFQATSLYGCSAWDSDYSRNFHFRVLDLPSGVIHFATDWSETIEGALQRGRAVRLDYNLARLPYCRQTYNGLGTWDIVARYRFDGGDVREMAVTRVDGFGRAPFAPRVEVPGDANQLEIWFMNTDRTGCTAWDSDYSRNYFFDAVP